MKKSIVLILTLAILLSLGLVPAAAEAPAETPAPTPAFTAPEDADAQLGLLFDQFNEFIQDDSYVRWSFTVTDLDHNDRLELLAGSIEGEGRFTRIMGWQVNEKKDGLDELSIPVAEGDSFPDIIVDAADCYHDKENDVWYYVFNDHVASAASQEAYLNKSAITLADSELKFYTYAYQHIEWVEGRMQISFTDRDGNAITSEEYTNADRNLFSDTEHSNCRLDWFMVVDVEGSGRFANSLEIFLGLIQPIEPDDPSVVPTPGPNPSSALMITKNPTDEHRYTGDTAWFVAGAANWTSAEWTFVDPYGRDCTWQSFQNRFYWCSVNGGYTGTITVYNVDPDMNGWGAYCTFYGNGQALRTTIAYFYISDAPQPTPQPDPTPIPSTGPIIGDMSGTVTDYAMSTVTINLDNGSTVTVLKDICSIDGDLYYGAPAIVYFYNYPNNDNIYSCTITGSHNPPSGSMGATFVGAVMGACSFKLDNGETVMVSNSIVTNYGTCWSGSSATVYYHGYSPSEDNIYHVDVFGDYGSDDSEDYGFAGGDGGVYFDPSANDNNADILFTGLSA